MKIAQKRGQIWTHHTQKPLQQHRPLWQIWIFFKIFLYFWVVYPFFRRGQQPDSQNTSVVIIADSKAYSVNDSVWNSGRVPGDFNLKSHWGECCLSALFILKTVVTYEDMKPTQICEITMKFYRQLAWESLSQAYQIQPKYQILTTNQCVAIVSVQWYTRSKNSNPNSNTEYNFKRGHCTVAFNKE